MSILSANKIGTPPLVFDYFFFTKNEGFHPIFFHFTALDIFRCVPKIS